MKDANEIRKTETDEFIRKHKKIIDIASRELEAGRYFYLFINGENVYSLSLADTWKLRAILNSFNYTQVIWDASDTEFYCV